jgi:DNA-binding NarL/FixJ family response regulator
MPRVLIVDDHAFIRRGVKAILQSFPEWVLVGEADNGLDAIKLAAQLNPDVIVMDVSMPQMNGIEATREISKSYPSIKIILLTLHDSAELLRNGFRAGAKGYILKSDAEQELIKALRVVSGDGSYISPSIDDSVAQKIVDESSAPR